MIAGEGKGFCAGGNVAEMFAKIQAGTQADETFDQNIDLLGDLAKYIRFVPKPVIAVVHGPVAGAGASIAMACDFCIAGEAQSFYKAFINLGLVPDTQDCLPW
jgi:2-(1,2-epoxy-1,2-dihydrophenyl)acetyl-CoA isomerase